MCGCMGCASVCGDDWAWVWDLLSSGLLVLLPMGGGALPLPAARGFTHLWARLDSQGTWPGALGAIPMVLFHGYCMFTHTHTHTHTFISPVPCLLSS